MVLDSTDGVGPWLTAQTATLFQCREILAGRRMDDFVATRWGEQLRERERSNSKAL